VLVASGVLRRSRDGIRVLAKGEITSKVTIEVTGASSGAVAAVEAAGGSLKVAQVAEATPADTPA
jgi:large subunit ribosomal protein L15